MKKHAFSSPISFSPQSPKKIIYLNIYTPEKPSGTFKYKSKKYNSGTGVLNKNEQCLQYLSSKTTFLIFLH